MADPTPRPPLREQEEKASPSPEPQKAPDAPDARAKGPAGYTPASVERRIAAWMGLGYMLMLLFVLTFAIFTGGKGLPGTFPLLLVPVCAAAGALSIYRQRMGASRLPLTVLMSAVCLLGVLLGLALGGPALVAAIQGAYTP